MLAVALALPVLPGAFVLAVVAPALPVLAVVALALPVLAVALDPLAAVEPAAVEAAVALVLPERAFSKAATMSPRPHGEVGVVLAEGAGVEDAAGAGVVGVGALDGVEDADAEAGGASLLVATIVRSPIWLTVAVFVPLSTLVNVSVPFLTTVTWGPCPPPPSEMFEPEPENPSTRLPVASFVTLMVVRPFISATRVVFVPSSTLVMVSPPSFVTVTVGAWAGADGAGVDEAVAGAGVDGAAAGAVAGEAAGAVDAAAGVAVAGEGAGAVDVEAGVAVAGEAAGAVDAEAGVAVAGVLELVGRAGGGEGSAAADPAGEVAPLVPADNDCIN